MGKLHNMEPGYKAERSNGLSGRDRGKVVIYDRRANGWAWPKGLKDWMSSPGRYAIICKVHSDCDDWIAYGSATTATSMAKSRELMKSPMEWCEACRRISQNKPGPTPAKSKPVPSLVSAMMAEAGMESFAPEGKSHINDSCPICGAGIMAEQVISRGNIVMDENFQTVIDNGTQTMSDELEIFCVGWYSHSQDEMANHGKK